MLTTELYRDMVRREKRLWVGVGALAVLWLLTVVFFSVVLILLTQERSKVIGYTPTGIPRYLEWKPGGTREIIEIQSFAKTVLVKTFTMKYSDFLGKDPLKVLSFLRPYYEDDYFKQFVEGLQTSQYIDRLKQLRAVTLASVRDPVEVQEKPDHYWVRAVMDREDITAKGRRTHTITYAMLVKIADRTQANPWGLKVAKLYTLQ